MKTKSKTLSNSFHDTAWWYAETCAKGGSPCAHRHKTPAAAERCLPRVPRSPRGSLTQNFSLARVHPGNDAAIRLDAESLDAQYDESLDAKFARGLRVFGLIAIRLNTCPCRGPR